MNVKELKELIEKLPDDMEVIIEKNEGNEFSPLDDGDTFCVYTPYDDNSGDVYDTRWTADEADMTEDEWNDMKSKPRSLILYPL